MDNCKVIAITNQKGGVGKTTTTVNLGVGLSMYHDKKVLLIDADPQSSLTASLLKGQNPDQLEMTLTTVMDATIEDRPIDEFSGILHHDEGVDLLPSNIELSGMETGLFNIMSREYVLRNYIDSVRKNYDYILIDCMPSLGMMTINALVAADSVIIPSQPSFLSTKGLNLLLHSINKIKRGINPSLKIDGILFTMVNNRTNNAKDIIGAMRDTVGQNIRVFDTEIPHSVRAAECSVTGESIFTHDKGGKVAAAYAGQEIEITETSASFTNDRQKAEVSLSKVMAQDTKFGIGSGSELSAVTFGLYADEDLIAADETMIPAGGLIEILSVSENGKASVNSDLPFGSYYVQEISTDCHYILSDEKYEITFDYAGQDVNIVDLKVNEGKSIVNELIFGEVHGMKKDDNGNGLGGATIGLFTTEGKEPIMTTVSAEDGSFSFKDVPYGEYVVREISAPEKYVMDDKPYDVKIAADGDVVEIEITNKLIHGNVQLTKVDANYPDHHLSGAEFEIYQNGELIGKMEELSDGVYEMDDLPYGDYTLKETKAPEGFYLDENTYAFSIKEDGKTVIVENEAGKGFINNAQVGDIRIEKTSEDGVLKGFTFRVEGTDITGNAFSKDYVTDENGQIHIEGLRVGDYVISEVSNKANEKYVLPDNVTVTVHEGKTVVAKFYNELKPVIPDIPKTGDSTNLTLWASLAGVSLLGACAAAFVTFRKKKEGGKHER